MFLIEKKLLLKISFTMHDEGWIKVYDVEASFLIDDKLQLGHVYRLINKLTE